VLHRVSTNDLATLAAGESRVTLFCDFRGRLLHRALVAHGPESVVWLVSDSPGDALAAFIDSRVFREDVRVEEGPVPPPSPLSGPVLAAFGADERARIVAGLPRFGGEIDEAFNPYEAGLAREVHLAKGCYTGQESLQRLVTYDSVRRQLVRVAGTGAPPAPQDVSAVGDVVGRLTSTAADADGWTGLAIVRLNALEVGAPLSLADGSLLAVVHRFVPAAPLGRG
jgi:folate-binding protein YgfZ